MDIVNPRCLGELPHSWHISNIVRSSRVRFSVTSSGKRRPTGDCIYGQPHRDPSRAASCEAVGHQWTNRYRHTQCVRSRLSWFEQSDGWCNARPILERLSQLRRLDRRQICQLGDALCDGGACTRPCSVVSWSWRIAASRRRQVPSPRLGRGCVPASRRLYRASRSEPITERKRAPCVQSARFRTRWSRAASVEWTTGHACAAGGPGTWMPALVRRTRTPSGRREQLEAALFWTGCVYNFCHVHTTLAGTPAMAADLTDHVWSIDELIRYRCRRE